MATGTMYVLGKTGDTRISWDREQAQEVAEARKAFDTYKAKGFRPFQMIRNRGQGEPMKIFDPTAEEVLFLVPIAGG